MASHCQTEAQKCEWPSHKDQPWPHWDVKVEDEEDDKEYGQGNVHHQERVLRQEHTQAHIENGVG